MATARKTAKPKGKKKAPRPVAKVVITQPHNVNITDTDENWVAWGKLVFKWITNASSRPTTVQLLRDAMRNATPRVYGDIRGAGTRAVQIIPYSGANILIPIPTDAMIEADKALLQAIAGGPVGERHYPLPEFYRLAFGGAAQVDMTFDEMKDMALRRLGEYVINECM
jgi:hypothetical protein